MTRRPCVAAFEGPCCAGKTTLARAVLQGLPGLTAAFAECYADHVGGGRFLPRQEAGSVEERELALHRLLAIEGSRLGRLPSGVDLILADRSVHTLLAHSYALERLTGIGLLAPSQRLLRESPIPAWPDLVIYLDLPQDAVHERNHGKFAGGSIYIDPGFNAAIRSYFLRLADQEPSRVAWLDATLEPAELARLTGTRLRHVVTHRPIQGTA
jgi:thymidylate kinase